MLPGKRKRIGRRVGPHLEGPRPEHDQITATIHHAKPTVRRTLGFRYVEPVIDQPTVDVRRLHAAARIDENEIAIDAAHVDWRDAQTRDLRKHAIFYEHRQTVTRETYLRSGAPGVAGLADIAVRRQAADDAGRSARFRPVNDSASHHIEHAVHFLHRTHSACASQCHEAVDPRACPHLHLRAALGFHMPRKAIHEPRDTCVWLLAFVGLSREGERDYRHQFVSSRGRVAHQAPN